MEADVEPDIRFRDDEPVRVHAAGLSPGDTIGQGASATALIAAPGVDTLRARALVSGTTADIELRRKLADGKTDAADQASATSLADGTEGIHSVASDGCAVFELVVTNTGAGPDVTIGHIDLFPTF